MDSFKKTFATVILVGLSIPLAFAAADTASDGSQFQFQPIVSIPLTSGGSVNGCTSLADYVNSVFKLAITVAIVLAVIMIIIDGFKYMTTEAVGTKKDALGGIRSAIFGLLLLLASYMILNIINPSINGLNVLNFSNGAAQGCAGGSQAGAQEFVAPNLGVNATPPIIDQGAGSWYFRTVGGDTYHFSSQSECAAEMQSVSSAHEPANQIAQTCTIF